MITQEMKNNFILENVTLNNKPAIICGRLNDFATVAVLQGEEHAEFSWEAVDRIIKNNKGEFKI